MSLKTRHRDSGHRHRFWAAHDREDYRCPDCGRSEDHPAVWRFEVHHRDEDPSNGDFENLVGLCHHCHLQRHGRTARETLADWKARVHYLGGGDDE